MVIDLTLQLCILYRCVIILSYDSNCAVTFIFFTATATQTQNCGSVQYVEKGKMGIIECSFEEGFFGVYWYNSTDFIDSYPIIYVSDSVKYGTGYTSGEYDIYPNGSLFIGNVTLKHENPYTVTYVQSLGEKTVIQEINVFVLGKLVVTHYIIKLDIKHLLVTLQGICGTCLLLFTILSVIYYPCKTQF